jgi:hypothetical protein
MSEQCHPYSGHVSRPFVVLTLSDPNGTTRDLTLLADTGNPYPFILHPAVFESLVHTRTRSIDSNFGRMGSGWVHLYMPDYGFSELVKAYSSFNVGTSLREENPDFSGLVGLPVLRLGEYGGNASDFWFRYPPPTPTSTP